MRNVVQSQHWPPLTRRSAKMSPSTVTHCYSEYSLLGTSYSEFIHSLLITTSLIPGYTRHKGRVGSAPSLRANLPVRPPAPKDHDSWGSFPQRGLKRPWPEFQVTRVISLELGSPLAYITNTTVHSAPADQWRQSSIEGSIYNVSNSI